MSKPNIKKFTINNRSFFLETSSGQIFRIPANRDMEDFSGYKPEKHFSEPPLPVEPVILHMSLAVTSDCNLNCSYCSCPETGFKNRKEYMSMQTAENAVDFLLAQSRNAKKLRILFSGGEPLLNFKLIEHIVEYAEKKAAESGKYIVFQIVTNGTISDKKKLKFIADKFERISVSLDGCSEMNNPQRPAKDNISRYDNILESITYLNKNAREKLSIDSVIYKHNRSLIELYNFFKNLGVLRFHFNYYFCGKEGDAYPAGKTDKNHLQELESLFNKYIKDFKTAKNKCYIGFYWETIYALLFGLNKAHGCSGGVTRVHVNPDGSIYTCNWGLGYEKFRIGNLENGLLKDKHSIFLERTAIMPAPCRNCWARALCGAGCFCINYKTTGDIDSPPALYCSISKLIIEQGITLCAELFFERIPVIDPGFSLSGEPR